MKRIVAVITALTLCAATSVYALYSVANEGLWPKTWSKELEPLRKQSRTLVGPLLEARHYAIPFTKREDFEAAWPLLLQAKTKGAPIMLVRGKNFFLDQREAGVVVHSPPEGQNQNPNTPEAPIPGDRSPRSKWMYTTYIELVVDGQIVDLNRIELPADTPIVDERFKDATK